MSKLFIAAFVEKIFVPFESFMNVMPFIFLKISILCSSGAKFEIDNLLIYFDPELKLVIQFKMRGLPTSILIDKKGKEFARVLGEVNFYDKKFIEFLKKYN